MTDSPRLYPLLPHATVTAPNGLTLAAGFVWLADGGLHLSYRLRGSIADLILPEPTEPAQMDGLWQHTCCEAFVSENGGPGYREFNLAPSGCWAAYRFTDYRQRDTDWQPAAAPHIACRHDDDGLWLTSTIPAALLPPDATRISLTAVIETRAGERSYWAMHHAAPQPDFHLSASFTLPLNRP